MHDLSTDLSRSGTAAHESGKGLSVPGDDPGALTDFDYLKKGGPDSVDAVADPDSSRKSKALPEGSQVPQADLFELRDGSVVRVASSEMTLTSWTHGNARKRREAFDSLPIRVENSPAPWDWRSIIDPFEVSDAETMLRFVNPDRKTLGPVLVLARHGCPHCQHAKELLTRHGYEFEAVYLGDELSMRGIKAVSGTATVPQVFIDGKLVGGADQLEKYLAEHPAQSAH